MVFEQGLTGKKMEVKITAKENRELAEASDEFSDALGQIAELAQQVADNATVINVKTDYLVSHEDMTELKLALQNWSRASEKLLRAL